MCAGGDSHIPKGDAVACDAEAFILVTIHRAVMPAIASQCYYSGVGLGADLRPASNLFFDTA